jgi:hypothetical protein
MVGEDANHGSRIGRRLLVAIALMKVTKPANKIRPNI